MLFFQFGGDGEELGAGAGDGDARFQAADAGEPMIGSHGVWSHGVAAEGEPELDRFVLEAGREDTGDGEGVGVPIVDPDGSAHDRGVLAEVAFPGGGGDQRDRRGSGLVFIGEKDAAHRGLDAEDREKIRMRVGDDHGPVLFGETEGQGWKEAVERDVLEDVRAGFPVLGVGCGAVQCARGRILIEVDQLGRVGIKGKASRGRY